MTARHVRAAEEENAEEVEEGGEDGFVLIDPCDAEDVDGMEGEEEGGEEEH